MDIPRELKLLGYFVMAVLAARSIVLILDAIAEAAERRTLYR